MPKRLVCCSPGFVDGHFMSRNAGIISAGIFPIAYTHLGIGLRLATY